MPGKIFFIFISLICLGVRSQNFQWAKALKGNDNVLNPAMVVDQDGNSYMVGVFKGTADFDPGPGVFTLTCVNSWSLPTTYDLYVLKLDSSGIFQWVKQITGIWYKEPSGMRLDPAGNLLITGMFSGIIDFDPGPGVAILTNTYCASYNVYTLKLNPNGDFIWVKATGEECQDLLCSDIAVDVSGSSYLTGMFKNSVDFDPGLSVYTLYSTTSLYHDLYISKLDSSGNFMWAKSIGGGQQQNGYSLDADATSNVYVTGYFQGTTDFDPGPGVYTLTSIGNEDIFITKFDSNGNFLWAKAFGGTGSDLGCSIRVDRSGYVYTTGIFRDSVDFDPGVSTYFLKSGSTANTFVSKLDPSGNFLWAKALQGTGVSQGTSLTLDSLSNIYYTGTYKDTLDFDPGSGVSTLISKDMNMFVSKLSSQGTFHWAKTLQPIDSIVHYSYGSQIALDYTNNIYVSGFFVGSYDFDPDAGSYSLTTAPTNPDGAFILKLGKCNTLLNSSGDQTICKGENNVVSASGAYSYTWNPGGNNTTSIPTPTSTSIYTVTGIKSSDCIGSAIITIVIDGCTGLNEIQKTNSQISIFPNPNNGEFTINSSYKTDLKLLDELGQLVYSIQLNNKNNFSISVSNLLNGIYFIVSEKGNQKIIVNR